MDNKENLPVFSRHNEEFLLKKRKRQAFHVGGNSLCQQHIWSHYTIYQERCAECGIKENHYAIPREVKNARFEAKKLEQSGQRTLDGMLSVPRQKEFSRENMLKAIAEFVVCDDQVSSTANLFQYLIGNPGPVPRSCKQGHILQLHGSNASSSYQHRLTIHPQHLHLCSQLLHQIF